MPYHFSTFLGGRWSLQVYREIFPAAIKGVRLHDSNSGYAIAGQNLEGRNVVRATACAQLHG